MDEYEYLYESLSLESGSVYVYGSFVKNVHVRGVSDFDVMILTSDFSKALKELSGMRIPLSSLLILDARVYTPYMGGIDRLHAFLATKYGERLCGEPVEINLSDEAIAALASSAASSMLQYVFKIAYAPMDPRAKLERLADALLSLALLYLIKRGFHDVTKPEVVNYEEEFEKNVYRAITKASYVKYGGVSKAKIPELIEAAERIVKEF